MKTDHMSLLKMYVNKCSQFNVGYKQQLMPVFTASELLLALRDVYNL